ncbi:hypothetical protein DXG01_001654 [Tephrocybe rancida]|nr:hypothetical protein DXG01_001654 [Tephrocybe rancida]
MWFYVSAPQQTLQYIAVVSHGKTPGEIDGDSNGLGNIEFNTRRGGKSYAYEIKELYQLHESLPLAEMREKYRVTFPQRYSYVTESMAKDIVYHDQIRLF